MCTLETNNVKSTAYNFSDKPHFYFLIVLEIILIFNSTQYLLYPLSGEELVVLWINVCHDSFSGGLLDQTCIFI